MEIGGAGPEADSEPPPPPSRGRLDWCKARAGSQEGATIQKFLHVCALHTTGYVWGQWWMDYGRLQFCGVPNEDTDVADVFQFSCGVAAGSAPIPGSSREVAIRQGAGMAVFSDCVLLTEQQRQSGAVPRGAESLTPADAARRWSKTYGPHAERVLEAEENCREAQGLSTEQKIESHAGAMPPIALRGHVPAPTLDQLKRTVAYAVQVLAKATQYRTQMEFMASAGPPSGQKRKQAQASDGGDQATGRLNELKAGVSLTDVLDKGADNRGCGGRIYALKRFKPRAQTVQGGKASLLRDIDACSDLGGAALDTLTASQRSTMFKKPKRAPLANARSFRRKFCEKYLAEVDAVADEIICCAPWVGDADEAAFSTAEPNLSQVGLPVSKMVEIARDFFINRVALAATKEDRVDNYRMEELAGAILDHACAETISNAAPEGAATYARELSTFAESTKVLMDPAPTSLANCTARIKRAPKMDECAMTLKEAEVPCDSFKSILDDFGAMGGQLRKGGANDFLWLLSSSIEGLAMQRATRAASGDAGAEAERAAKFELGHSELLMKAVAWRGLDKKLDRALQRVGNSLRSLVGALEESNREGGLTGAFAGMNPEEKGPLDMVRSARDACEGTVFNAASTKRAITDASAVGLAHGVTLAKRLLQHPTERNEPVAPMLGAAGVGISLLAHVEMPAGEDVKASRS
ncbi:unnamed protein product, partial [Prorocentrum cordatum]